MTKRSRHKDPKIRRCGTIREFEFSELRRDLTPEALLEAAYAEWGPPAFEISDPKSKSSG